MIQLTYDLFRARGRRGAGREGRVSTVYLSVNYRINFVVESCRLTDGGQISQDGSSPFFCYQVPC